jgi:hypothetical protein
MDLTPGVKTGTLPHFMRSKGKIYLTVVLSAVLGFSHASFGQSEFTNDGTKSVRALKKQLLEMGPLSFFKRLAESPYPLTGEIRDLYDEYQLDSSVLMAGLNRDANRRLHLRLLKFLLEEFAKPEVNQSLICAWLQWDNSRPLHSQDVLLHNLPFYDAWLENIPAGKFSTYLMELAFDRLTEDSMNDERRPVFQKFLSVARREKKLTHLLMRDLEQAKTKRFKKGGIFSEIIKTADVTTLSALLNYHFEAMIGYNGGSTIESVLLVEILSRLLSAEESAEFLPQDCSEIRRMMISRIGLFFTEKTNRELNENRKYRTRAQADGLAPAVAALTHFAEGDELRDIANQIFTLRVSLHWPKILESFLQKGRPEEVDFLIEARLRNHWALQDAESFVIFDKNLDSPHQETVADNLMDRKMEPQEVEEILVSCPQILQKYRKARRLLSQRPIFLAPK